MGNNQRNDSSTKKKVRQTARGSSGAIFMLRCAELGLSKQDLEEMSIGMVFDMCVEKSNDMEKYPYIATQADMDAFFGEVPGK